MKNEIRAIIEDLLENKYEYNNMNISYILDNILEDIIEDDDLQDCLNSTVSWYLGKFLDNTDFNVINEENKQDHDYQAYQDNMLENGV